MKPDLDPQRIADAALKVVTERGLAGFTMRAVADALGVTPMALYHHVEDKAALAALVVDAASRKRPLPPPSGDWREDLVAMALWSRESTLETPALSRLRSTYQIWTPAILHMTERWMSLWQQSGLPLEAAIRAGSMSSMVVVGVVEHELALRGMKPPADGLMTFLPNARTAFSATQDRQANFELLIRATIDGLLVRLREGD